jgi:hypothetical protein
MTGAARPYRQRLGQSSHKAEDDISTRLSFLARQWHTVTVLKERRNSMPPKDQWLTVFNRGLYEEVPDEAKAILDANPDIGLPSSDAWMARYARAQERRYEIVLGVDELISSYGFENSLDWAGKDTPPAAIWIPRDETDCKSVVRDLDLTREQRSHLESVLIVSIGDPSKAIYAVRKPNSRKSEGLIVYERNLEFFNDFVQIQYDVEFFHCSSDPVLEAALFASFNEQTSTDLQGALDSMTRAGITPRLYCTLDAPVDYLHERLSEIVDLAKGELFDLDPMPHVDIEAFGSWLSGISKDDENHILIPKRQPTIPSA